MKMNTLFFLYCHKQCLKQLVRRILKWAALKIFAMYICFKQTFVFSTFVLSKCTELNQSRLATPSMVVRMISETFKSDFCIFQKVAGLCFPTNVEKLKGKNIQTRFSEIFCIFSINIHG